MSDRERDALHAMSRQAGRLLERRRLHEELQQFAVAVGEDLRDPLTGVIGHLELAQTGTESLDDRTQDHLELAMDGADRIGDLLETLRAYTSIGSGRSRREPVDLGSVAADVLADLRPRIDDLGAEVVVHDLPTVEADPDQAYYVLMSLVRNAVELKVDGEHRIEVQAERQDGHARIAVVDGGAAITAEEREAILDRVPRPRADRSAQSMAIGLRLCKRIVEDHGGAFEVTSPPDRGAAFSFTLPLSDA